MVLSPSQHVVYVCDVAQRSCDVSEYSSEHTVARLSTKPTVLKGLFGRVEGLRSNARSSMYYHTVRVSEKHNHISPTRRSSERKNPAQ